MINNDGNMMKHKTMTMEETNEEEKLSHPLKKSTMNPYSSNEKTDHCSSPNCEGLEFSSANTRLQLPIERSISTFSVVSKKTDQGKKQINQYVILHKLGQGNFASVRLCKNVEDDKMYAIKILNKKKLSKMFLRKNKATELIESEMAILKKLDHPNVLRCIEIIDDNSVNKLYLITEWVKNGSLQALIDNHGKLDEDLSRQVFRDLITALEYCHDWANVIHRDIKPENILLDETNHAKLADFGVSTLMENGIDDIASNAGSKLYFSPEATLGSNFKGRQSDIWACGVTLYVMLTGVHPFKGSTLIDL